MKASSTEKRTELKNQKSPDLQNEQRVDPVAGVDLKGRQGSSVLAMLESSQQPRLPLDNLIQRKLRVG